MPSPSKDALGLDGELNLSSFSQNEGGAPRVEDFLMAKKKEVMINTSNLRIFRIFIYPPVMSK